MLETIQNEQSLLETNQEEPDEIVNHNVATSESKPNSAPEKHTEVPKIQKLELFEEINAILQNPRVELSHLKQIVQDRISSAKRRTKALKWLLKPNGSEGKAKTRGYVYVYVKEGHQNLCKVGCTEKTVTERTRRWQTKCGFKIESKHSTNLLPYCEACERLIHCELKDKGMWRDQPKCSGCNQRHVEWFEGEPKRIIEVVKFWDKVIRETYAV